MAEKSISELKKGLSIVSLASDYGLEVRSVRGGGVTDCPLCGKAKHLYLYEDTQSYKCFIAGCEAHGDYIGFIAMMESCSNADACKLFLERNSWRSTASSPPKFTDPQPSGDQTVDYSQVYTDVYNLLDLPTSVVNYLCAQRCLSMETLEEFGVRGIDDPPVILKHIMERYTAQELVAAGLASTDRFGHLRLSFLNSCAVFPHRMYGRITYLSCRALESKIKTPCLPGRPKVVYNQDTLASHSDILLFEGIINALSYYELSGQRNFIATLGTLSYGAFAKLREENPDHRFVSAYDPDSAGQSATSSLNIEALDWDKWIRRLGYRCVPADIDKAWDMNDILVDYRYRFEERAGIMEYEGGLSREEAERQAGEILSRESL